MLLREPPRLPQLPSKTWLKSRNPLSEAVRPGSERLMANLTIVKNPGAGRAWSTLLFLFER